MNSEIRMPILNSITADMEVQKPGARPQVEVEEKPQEISEENISEAELESAVTEMNSVAQNLQRNLLFSVDENTGGTFVKVVDKETDETVREIPSKEIREIKARLEEVAGMIFNKSV